MRQWCERHGVPFCSITADLRQRASEGEQVYYTYDQHWTPDGHEIVAETVYRFWMNELVDTQSGLASTE